MLLRRRKLEPLQPRAYVTLAEVKQRGLKVSMDDLVPADRQRVSAHHMREIDDLPPEVRHVINYVRDGSLVHAYVNFAVRNLDIGYPPVQVAEAIRQIDARGPVA